MPSTKELLKRSMKRGEDDYYSVVDADGVMRCSCGRELEQIDEDTYRCPGGYPVYRFSKQEVFIDKFGNLMARRKPHGQKQNRR